MTPFAALHRAGHPLLLPNAWDVASAVALAADGHPAIGTTSLGVAAAAGRPDAAGATRTETLALARALGRLPFLLTVDVEGGFADDPAAVADLAAELAELGAVGVNVEDGRADGTLADRGHLVAVVAAVKARVPDLFVNARTDTVWLAPGPPDLDETLARGSAYLTAGADGVFVPGALDPATVRLLAGELDGPLNVLLGPGGRTVRGLGELGVARVSTGSLLFRAALHATVTTAGVARSGGALPTDLPSYRDVQALVAPP